MFTDEYGRTWQKGNLHMHTSLSDGRLSPENAIRIYREAGYDFISLTDHWKCGRTELLKKDFLLLSGCEYDSGNDVRQGIYHIVGIGMETEPKLRPFHDASPQEIIEEIHKAGGIAILAHPAWSMNQACMASDFHGFDGCEIYNTVSGSPWNCRPYSGSFLDDMANRNIFLPVMAADDAHFYSGDETRSFLFVQSHDLSREGVMSAIRNGNFIASQGPFFTVRREGNEIIVRTTPVDEAVFFTDSIYEPDRVTRGKHLCEAHFQIKDYDHWVRVELKDAKGRMAWSKFIAV